MASTSESPPPGGPEKFLLPAPVPEVLKEVLSANLENLVLIRPENLASVCGHYLSLVQSMLTVYVKRDSYHPVVNQIGEMVANSISEIDMELVKKLTLNPSNPTHAHYVQKMPVIFMIDRLKDFASTLSRGFTTSNPDYNRLEIAITEGWKALNGYAHWVRCPGAKFEMKSLAEFTADGFGNFYFSQEIVRFVTLIGKIQRTEPKLRFTDSTLEKMQLGSYFRPNEKLGLEKCLHSYGTRAYASLIREEFQSNAFVNNRENFNRFVALIQVGVGCTSEEAEYAARRSLETAVGEYNPSWYSNLDSSIIELDDLDQTMLKSRQDTDIPDTESIISGHEYDGSDAFVSDMEEAIKSATEALRGERNAIQARSSGSNRDLSPPSPMVEVEFDMNEFAEVSDENLVRLNVLCLMSSSCADIRIKASIKTVGVLEKDSPSPQKSNLTVRLEEKRVSKKKKVGISWGKDEIKIVDRTEPRSGHDLKWDQPTPRGRRLNPMRETMILRLSALYSGDQKIRRETSALSRGLLDRPESERNFARPIPASAIINPELSVPRSRGVDRQPGLTAPELDLRSDKEGKKLDLVIPFDPETRLYEQSVEVYARLKQEFADRPADQRVLKTDDGETFEAILARPEFLPETWQNRVISQNSSREEDLAPLQSYSTSDCFYEHPKYKEEDAKKISIMRRDFMMLVSDGDMHVFDIAHSRTIKHMQCKGMPAGGIHRAVCKDETCRTTGACQKRWSTVDCHNLSKVESVHLVIHRLYTAAVGQTRSYQDVPEVGRQKAKEAGVDLDSDLVRTFSVHDNSAALGLPPTNHRLYGGDPRGNFPGKFLIIRCGWGVDNGNAFFCDTKFFVYAILRQFGFTVFADLYYGNLCIDLTECCLEQVKALNCYFMAVWSFQGHAAQWGWSIDIYNERMGGISKHDSHWPRRVAQTRFNLTHDRSASRFHDIMAVVETLKNCGPDDRDHYLLTKSSRVHRLRKSQTYRDVFKMSRMEIMKRVHEADPEVCGTVKPLGNRVEFTTLGGMICSHPLCYNEHCINNRDSIPALRSIFDRYALTSEGREAEADTNHRLTFRGCGGDDDESSMARFFRKCGISNAIFVRILKTFGKKITHVRASGLPVRGKCYWLNEFKLYASAQRDLSLYCYPGTFVLARE